MAAALEGFSIREYTARMRIVDATKCWPFAADDARERPLPPMSFRKFRWWSDELNTARSSTGLGHGSTGEAATPAAEAKKEKEGSEKEFAKARQRVTKKRSISELFAAVCQSRPPKRKERKAIKKVNIGKMGTAFASEVSDREKKKKKRKKKVKRLAKKCPINGRDKKTDKKQILFKRVSSAERKKEKDLKPKRSYSTNVSQLFQDCSCRKRLRRTFRHSLDIHKKKQETVPDFVKKENKLMQSSKLVSNNQEMEKISQVQSIVRNYKRKAHSMMAESLMVDTQAGSPRKSCCRLENHVTFSGKDDIIENKKTCSLVERPHLLNISKLFSDTLPASLSGYSLSRDNTVLPPTVHSQMVNGSERDRTPSVAELTFESPPEKQQFGDGYDNNTSSELNNNKERISLCTSSDLDRAIQSSSKFNCSNPGNSAFSSSHFKSTNMQVWTSRHKEGANSDFGIQVERTLHKTADVREDPSSQVSSVSELGAAISLTMAGNADPFPYVSFTELNIDPNKRGPDLLMTSKYITIPVVLPICSLSAKDKMTSARSLVASRNVGKAESAPISMSKFTKCLVEDFIGLSLNSQGEITKLQSGGKFGISEQIQQQDTDSVHNIQVPCIIEPNSSIGCVNTIWNNQFRSSSGSLYPSIAPLISRVGYMQLPGLEKIEIFNHASRGYDKQPEQPKKLRAYYNHCSENNSRDHDWIAGRNFRTQGNSDDGSRPIVQQTLRLMGKNVDAGRSSKYGKGCNDGKPWIDKEIITECRPSTVEFDKTLSNAHLIHPQEHSIAYYNCVPMQQRPDHRNFGYQSQWRSRSESSSTSAYYGLALNSLDHSPIKLRLNQTSQSRVDSINRFSELEDQVPPK